MMVKRVVFGLAILALMASASEAAIIRGVRGRRLLRHQYLIKKWTNDKLDVYRKHGFPRHRYRVYGYGRVREHWKYYKLGIEFVFDDESRIVKTSHFWPEDRRERFKRF
ncbi:MAG TPA: hypothetical protein VKO43_05345 [Candidatus Krumholzibacteriaceae bacterium]|nr:hypothetical protein [Candidatus Krumholzibacteriaceae bacterium]